FSSRRRHTRFSRDWSSDVCSSDLNLTPLSTQDQMDRLSLAVERIRDSALSGQTLSSAQLHSFTENAAQVANVIEHEPEALSEDRSEERRVGKECGERGQASHGSKR